MTQPNSTVSTPGVLSETAQQVLLRTAIGGLLEKRAEAMMLDMFPEYHEGGKIAQRLPEATDFKIEFGTLRGLLTMKITPSATAFAGLGPQATNDMRIKIEGASELLVGDLEVAAKANPADPNMPAFDRREFFLAVNQQLTGHSLKPLDLSMFGVEQGGKHA